MKGEAEPVEIGGHFGHVIVSEIRSCGIEKGLLALFLHQMFFFFSTTKSYEKTDKLKEKAALPLSFWMTFECNSHKSYLEMFKINIVY